MIDESDRNLLEAYLDDALSAAEVQRLDSRLSYEPGLVSVFNSLRSERAARVAVFNASAPAEAEADRFAGTMLASIHHRQHKARLVRHLRVAASVAACLIVGFAVGWMARAAVPQVTVVHSVPISPAVAPARAHTDAQLAIHSPNAQMSGQYQVAVLDADGNVVALQKFVKLEDARQFADDLGQFEVRRQQVQQSQAMLVSDRF